MKVMTVTHRSRFVVIVAVCSFFGCQKSQPAAETSNYGKASDANKQAIKIVLTPQQGPIGTVVTVTVSPPGTGLLSSNTTVEIKAKAKLTGYADTSTTTLIYSGNNIYYDTALPDQVKFVVGAVRPPAAWFALNSQIFQADSGSIIGTASLNFGALSCSTSFTFTLTQEGSLGHLASGPFVAVSPIDSGMPLIAQILIKDDGLGVAPNSITVKIQSYDKNNVAMTTSPKGCAPSYQNLMLTLQPHGTKPGYHVYWSDSTTPIIPWAYVMEGSATGTAKYLYYQAGGRVRVQYVP